METNFSTYFGYLKDDGNKRTAKRRLVARAIAVCAIGIVLILFVGFMYF